MVTDENSIWWVGEEPALKQYTKNRVRAAEMTF